MIEQKNSVTKTKRLAALIVDDKPIDQESMEAAKQCLIDFLSCILAASNNETVSSLKKQLGLEKSKRVMFADENKPSERLALFNGYASHYLDLDDVQSNVRGHPSVVIYSALLSILKPEDKLIDLFKAFVIGVEVEGLLGKQLNPKHKLDGYHSTATLGVFGAAAAIAKFKKLSVSQTMKILSFAGDQSAGLGLESGTDNKPLHAGMAARNAVSSLQFVDSLLTTNMDIFNDVNGWNKTVINKNIDIEEIEESWLNAPQILNPGIWFKRHQFCSAAMSGYDAAVQAYQKGIRFEDVRNIFLHFRLDEDKVLRYKEPINGQQGKFSIEYIVWQVLTNGDVDDHVFDSKVSTKEFINQSKGKFLRKNDLVGGDSSKRIINLEVQTNDGHVETFLVTDPIGSPSKSPTLDETYEKLTYFCDDNNIKLDIDDLKNSFTKENCYWFLNTLNEI